MPASPHSRPGCAPLAASPCNSRTDGRAPYSPLVFVGFGLVWAGIYNPTHLSTAQKFSVPILATHPPVAAPAPLCARAGGAKVLDGLGEALQLDASRLGPSRDTLWDYGNVSSR